MITGIREEILYEIEKFVENYKLSYLDATLAYCEINDYDAEYVGSIIVKVPKLKSKLEREAEQLHFIKKSDRLPII